MKLLTLTLMTAISSLHASNLYDHKLKTIDGEETSLSEHKGKVILMVNVASRCGFTRQYKGLEELYQKYKEKGLVICGFPCNQFGGQEPGSESDIKEFCSTKFGVSFPMYSKIDVNGPTRHPLYEEIIGDNGPLKGKIKWNFGKILIGKDGKPIDRFGSMTSPTSGKLIKAIEKSLEG
ncbi:MAG: glutathione peroxidase [Opitutae bacterium]|jgi:glutathione peroxidase|nr:glutathione peroxidase [Opitutae bacterium]